MGKGRKGERGGEDTTWKHTVLPLLLLRVRVIYTTPELFLSFFLFHLPFNTDNRVIFRRRSVDRATTNTNVFVINCCIHVMCLLSHLSRALSPPSTTHRHTPTHGALTIAFKNPDEYASVSAFAPICNPSAVPWGEKAFGAYLGDAAAGEGWVRQVHLAPPHTTVPLEPPRGVK